MERDLPKEAPKQKGTADKKINKRVRSLEDVIGKVDKHPAEAENEGVPRAVAANLERPK